MSDPRLEDHLTGLELQIVDLEERRMRAEVQGRAEDAARIRGEMDEIQREMAATSEKLASWRD